MMTRANRWRELQINGGTVSRQAAADFPLRLQIPAAPTGYANGQIDDYGGRRRRRYPWRPAIQLSLHARFSAPPAQLQGTAGFGFWNAPFGDPTIPLPALPQAVWFFWGSPPNHLPFFPEPPGHGGYMATIDATRAQALLLAPFAPLVLLVQRNTAVRRRLWPWVQRRLRITHAPIPVADTAWHHYRLRWAADHCAFWVDGRLLFNSPASPRGPLGFVCWIDNQYLTLTPWGEFRWGTLSCPVAQWLEITDLAINPGDPSG